MSKGSGSSLSVLFVLLLELKKVSDVKKVDVISQIEMLLVDNGIVSEGRIEKELKDFDRFVDSVQRYMVDQEMSEDDAISTALVKYPQFGSINLN